MRKELQSLLSALIAGRRDLDRLLDERFNAFAMPPASFTGTVVEFDSLLGAFYLALQFPPSANLSDSENWAASKALLLLRRDYETQTRIRCFDIARSGVEGGLPVLLRRLTRRIGDDLAQTRSLTLVNPYWRRTDPITLLGDGRDYVAEYGHLLPAEMLEDGGIVILDRFHKTLLHHSTLLADIRKSTPV